MPQHIVSLTGRLLGALLYYAPDDEHNVALIERLRHSAWQQTWPCGNQADIATVARQIHSGLQPGYDERLSLAWKRWLSGDEGMPVPPWGSVYLDRQNVLFGDSTLALRRWQRGVRKISQTACRNCLVNICYRGRCVIWIYWNAIAAIRSIRAWLT